MRAFVGPPLEDSFADLGLPREVVTDAVAVYRAHYDLLASPLYPGVLDVLDALRKARLPLALATSKPQPFAELVVASTALSGRLDIVVGSDRQAGRVTKGDVIGQALAQLGNPGAPVMVGDRLHDVEGAAEHGLACIGALWGYGSAAELSRAGAAALASRPTELVRLLLPNR